MDNEIPLSCTAARTGERLDVARAAFGIESSRTRCRPRSRATTFTPSTAAVRR
jgi:hypothetical protein